MKKYIITNAFSINMLPEARALSVRFLKFTCMQEVRDELECLKTANQLLDGIVNAIGHADLASIVQEMIPGLPEAQRITVALDADTVLIVAQYRGPRLPEGTTQLPDGSVIEFYEVELQ